MYRLGSSGTGVRLIRSLIRSEDSSSTTFDEDLELKVKAFQKDKGLTPDGIVGPKTWEALWAAPLDVPSWREPLQRVLLPKGEGKALQKLVKAGLSYDRLTLRASSAKRLEGVLAVLTSVGGIFTTAGGMRGLSATVTAARSPTSFHYLGRAFDLGTYTAMVDPHTDPFLVCRDKTSSKPYRWRVFARAARTGQDTMTVAEWEKAHDGQPFEPITRHGTVVTVDPRTIILDATALFARFGFERIACRAKAWEKPSNFYAGSEWWHFQDETDLVAEQTTFGEELLKVHPIGDLQGSGPWSRRAGLWRKDWA